MFFSYFKLNKCNTEQYGAKKQFLKTLQAQTREKYPASIDFDAPHAWLRQHNAFYASSLLWLLNKYPSKSFQSFIYQSNLQIKIGVAKNG